MATKQTVAELDLKAERVQEPAFAALGAGGPLSSAFELTINQRRPVAGSAQAPGLGEAA